MLGSALIVVHSLRADRVELVGAIDDLRDAISEASADDGAETGTDESLAAHRAATAARSAPATADQG